MINLKGGFIKLKFKVIKKMNLNFLLKNLKIDKLEFKVIGI